MGAMQFVREVRVTNGSEVRSNTIYRDSDGRYWMQDERDENSDSLEELQDDSDIAVNDAVRYNGFEVASTAVPVCPHCGGTLKPNTLRHAHSGAGSEDYVCERCDVYASKADADAR